MPTFADVLATCPPGAFLDVELKEDLGEAVLARSGLPEVATTVAWEAS